MNCFYGNHSVVRVVVSFTDGRTRYFCDKDYLEMIRPILQDLDPSSYTVRFLPGSRLYGEGLNV